MENLGEIIKFNSLERRFYLKDKELELSDSFRKARTAYIKKKGKHKLKLFYDNKKDLYSDFIKICSFLKRNDLWEDFESKQGQEEIRGKLETDVIYLIGPKIELHPSRKPKNPPAASSYEPPTSISDFP